MRFQKHLNSKEKNNKDYLIKWKRYTKSTLEPHEILKQDITKMFKKFLIKIIIFYIK